MKFRLCAILLLFALLFSGCTTLDHSLNKAGYQKIDQANQKIEVVKQEAAKQQEALNKQIEEQKQSITKITQEQMQGAADELFFANYAFSLNPAPDRNATVVNYHVKGATDYIHMSPSTAAVTEALTEVKQELDTTKTTNADLEKKYNDLKVQADALVKAKSESDDKIKTLQADKDNITTQANAKINDLQQQKDTATKAVLNAQQDAINKANDHKVLIQKLMMYTGGIAVLALIAAIYAPVFKTESATLAAILGAVTVALPFIEMWMIGVVASAATVVLLVWIGYKHHILSKVTSNLVNAIQDVKEKAKDVFDNHIKPALESWNTKYAKDPSGNTVAVPDPSVVKAIDQTLVANQRK